MATVVVEGYEDVKALAEAFEDQIREVSYVNGCEHVTFVNGIEVITRQVAEYRRKSHRVVGSRG